MPPERPFAVEKRPEIGLCGDCQHVRQVPGARTTFYMCQRSFTDSRFPKYPPLPVIRCLGYEQKREPDVI